jgi:hypothetical protein
VKWDVAGMDNLSTKWDALKSITKLSNGAL